MESEKRTQKKRQKDEMKWKTMQRRNKKVSKKKESLKMNLQYSKGKTDILKSCRIKLQSLLDNLKCNYIKLWFLYYQHSQVFWHFCERAHSSLTFIVYWIFSQRFKCCALNSFCVHTSLSQTNAISNRSINADFIFLFIYIIVYIFSFFLLSLHEYFSTHKLRNLFLLRKMDRWSHVV